MDFINLLISGIFNFFSWIFVLLILLGMLGALLEIWYFLIGRDEHIEEVNGEKILVKKKYGFFVWFYKS